MEDNMGFASEGVKLIVGGVVAAALGGVVMYWCRGTGMTLLCLGLVFAAFSSYFFRDPERDKVFAPGEIACPADGTVMTVRNEGAPGITVVRIFLSVLNVHVQRAPMDGKVSKTLYTKGSFAIAYKPEAATNERNLGTTRKCFRFETHIFQYVNSLISQLVPDCI